MAHFSTYFCITSTVIHLTMSKFVCSELYILLLSFIMRSSFSTEMKSLIRQHLLPTTVQTLNTVIWTHCSVHHHGKKNRYAKVYLHINTPPILTPCWYSPSSFESDQTEVRQGRAIWQNRARPSPRPAPSRSTPHLGVPCTNFPHPTPCRHPVPQRAGAVPAGSKLT